jgi:hypothetical protein
MLKKRVLKLVIPAIFLFILVLPVFVYIARSPVLIVTDISSVPLYGEARIRSETRKASIALFRKVRVVTVADNASNDMIRYAVSEASSHPNCVIFQLRFMYASRLYHESNPLIPVILLVGRYSLDTAFFASDNNQNSFFIYKTDLNDEFYRVFITASALDIRENGKIAVFLDQTIQSQAEDTIFQVIDNMETPIETFFFSSFSQFYEISDLSCAVLAGTGIEFLENNQDIPVIFLTWIDPSLLPDSVFIIVDDSPWAQAVQAVRMAGSSVVNGQIKSKFIINKKNIDKQTLRKLKK